MEREKYNLIYDYYECNILFGHLEQGSLLPTIEPFCDAFQVAPQKVCNALRKLPKFCLYQNRYRFIG